jgi:hypothetical protein
MNQVTGLIRLGHKVIEPVVSRAFMPRQIIELSVPLQSGIASDPAPFLSEINYIDHNTGAKQLVSTFAGLKASER